LNAGVLLAEFLGHDDAGRVLLSLRAEGQIDFGCQATFEERFFAAQRRREEQPWRRAITRCELPADFDVNTARQLLVGPLYAAAEEGGLTEAVVEGPLSTFRSAAPSWAAPR
jgi:Tetracyclin repressor-like, C-terminal domain